MSSDLNERPAPDALAASARALALAICAALAGCQSAPVEHSRLAQTQIKLTPIMTEQVQRLEKRLEKPPEAPVHQDIWARIREGYKLQEHLGSNPRIEQQRLLFASRPRSIEISSERGGLYIHYIVERLEEQNMPLELALLPIIESSYNPFAYSHAHAVGLWQFIPSTGRHFNLQQTSWYDGRRDITASTNAALKYLNYLHGLFNGDWLLALASYNAGEGTVSRAIERNQKLGLPTDYWNLPLPAETRDYVPKLLALSQLIHAPEAYGINLSPVANEPYFEIVPLKQRMDLARVAALVEIDEEELYKLNPAFTRRVMFEGSQQLLVPSEKAELLVANLALMKPQELVDWQQYKVRPGDSLGAIANRHHLTVNVIRDINQLKSDTLRIGQTLSIPASANGPASGAALHAVAHSAPAKSRNYRVRQGDNLWDIARSQKVSVRDLQRWNKLSGSALRAGQTLALQGPAAQSGKAAPTYYKVKRGDSLYLIAKRFNVRINHLKSWNPKDSAMLKPGQMLTLYLPR